MPDENTVSAGVGRRTIRTILIIQAAITAAAFLLLSVISSDYAAWSAAAGGSIGLMTTAFFSARVFFGSSGRSAKTVVRSFYVGETQKILLTVVLFLAAILWLQVAFLPMFVTYMVTLMAFWLVLLPLATGPQE